MTDRLRSITVVLDQDYREDDAEPILAALRMVKGVAGVTWTTADWKDQIAQEAGTREMRSVLYEVLRLCSFGGDGDRYKRLKELLGVK